MNRAVLLSILLIAAVLAPIALSASKPDWVAPGKYAEYQVKSSTTSETATLRWEIKEVYDTYAVVAISGKVLGQSLSTTINWEFGSKITPLSSLGPLVVNVDDLKKSNPPMEDKTVPAGTFKCYKVEENIIFATYRAWYEASTGILVAMEVSALGQSVTLELKSTNIISGALNWMWIVIIVVVVIVVVVAVVLVAKKLKKPKAPAQPQQPIPSPQQGPR